MDRIVPFSENFEIKLGVATVSVSVFRIVIVPVEGVIQATSGDRGMVSIHMYWTLDQAR
jgi:hypothetical protein